jgi:hypothetical protein
MMNVLDMQDISKSEKSKCVSLASMIQAGHDDVTIDWKSPAYQAGPLSPTDTDESSTSADDSDNIDRIHSFPSTPVPCQPHDEDWNLVSIPLLDSNPHFVPVSILKDASLPSTAGCNPPRLEDTVAAVDDAPTKLPSSADVQATQREEHNPRLHERQGSKELDPLKMLKKGAVAALGGTMVGVGLIMIPLPTPFGVAVASSGMAVLGTEFEGAKVLNDRIASEAKTHWKIARQKIIQGIEEMKNDDTPTKMMTSTSEQVQKQSEGEATTIGKPPILMNELEAKRQRAQKRPEFVDEWRKSAGAYLSKHLVPLLTSPSHETESDSENSVNADDSEYSEDTQSTGTGSLN